MWDTGLPEHLVKDSPGSVFDGDIVFSRKDSITHQLKRIGLSPKDIDYIAFSHGHIDHVGGRAPFEKATLLVQKIEYNFFSDDPNAPTPNPYAEFSTVKKLTGDFDVFGDQKA